MSTTSSLLWSAVSSRSSARLLRALTNENTKASYDSASGHKTQTVTIGDTVYEGGYYAQAIRDMCSELHLICVDLTDATINENITMGKRLSTPTALPAQKKAKRAIWFPPVLT